MDDGQTILTPAGAVRVCRAATAAEVIDLRHAILRPGLPRETAMFPGDCDSGTRHIVAVAAGDGRVVGCATVVESSWQGEPAWQLRGMAVDPAFRAAGTGRAMLVFLERMLRAESRVTQLWCDARVPAAGFYERMGWQIASDTFHIPPAGPHVKMTKSLA